MGLACLYLINVFDIILYNHEFIANYNKMHICILYSGKCLRGKILMDTDFKYSTENIQFDE